jgi:NAD(P)-dependent dehydrogenase (short-subunit alcohol dehydrogenase family)
MEQSVFITGASSGIGKACALSLAAEGFRVFAGVRKLADGEALRREQKATNGQAANASREFEIEPILIEVTDSASVAEAARTLEERLGGKGLDGLINNAGIAISGPLEFLPFAQFEQQMRVNVNGQLAVTQACLPLLRRAKGRIIFMSSESGRFALPLLGAYAASKFALEGLADSLRVELSPAGIRVVVIEPGTIKTPIFDKAVDMNEKLLSSMPSQAQVLYERELKVLRQSSKHSAHTAISPEKVAQSVIHALTTKRPSARYVVGLEARLLVTFFSLAPTRLGDAVRRRGVDLLARLVG